MLFLDWGWWVFLFFKNFKEKENSSKNASQPVAEESLTEDQNTLKPQEVLNKELEDYIKQGSMSKPL